jgi:hypothetical protein
VAGIQENGGNLKRARKDSNTELDQYHAPGSEKWAIHSQQLQAKISLL